MPLVRKLYKNSLKNLGGYTFFNRSADPLIRSPDPASRSLNPQTPKSDRIGADQVIDLKRIR